MKALAKSETVKMRVEEFNRETSLDVFLTQVYDSD